MRRAAVVVPVFALLSGAIAWGVLTDARAARLEAILEQIEAAETRASYAGVREIRAAETVRLKAIEGDVTVETDGGARDRYLAALHEHAESWRRILLGRGARFVSMTTDRDPIAAVRAIIEAML